MTPPNLRHFYIILYIISLKAQPICPTSDMPVPIGQKLWETFWSRSGHIFLHFNVHFTPKLNFDFFFFFTLNFSEHLQQRNNIFSWSIFSLFKYNCHLFKGYIFCRQGNNDNLFKQSPLFSCQIVAVLDFFSIQHKYIHRSHTYP